MTNATNSMGSKANRILGMGVVLFVILSKTFMAAAAEDYTHDGLHIRFGIGIAASGGSYENRENNFTFTGVGLLDGVQAGWAVKENLLLFAEADSLTLFSVTENSTTRNTGDHSDNTPVNGFLFGAGIGHYFMPSNVYISAAAGIAFTNVLLGGGDENGFNKENACFGFSMMAGKDWWVSPKWVVGIAAQILYMNNPANGTNGLVSQTVASGLLATVAFN